MTNALRHISIALSGLLLLSGASQCFPQTATARIGILAIDEKQPWFKPFESTLAKHGWVPGQNLVVDYRNAGGDASRYPSAAQALVRSEVQVILAMSAPAVHAARAATRSIPIVGMDFTTDVVAAGYANSYARPGQNVTGVFLDAPAFTGKLLELLRALLPDLKRIAVLWDPAPGSTHRDALQSAAQAAGIRVQVLEVRIPADIDQAFADLRPRPQAVVVLPSPMLYFHSARIAKLTMQHRLPAISMFRLFGEAGGTLSYGPESTESVERCAIIIARILDGASASELPIERPAKFELVVNLKSADALGIAVPDRILTGADALIR